jgi:hypothetical protein
VRPIAPRNLPFAGSWKHTLRILSAALLAALLASPAAASDPKAAAPVTLAEVASQVAPGATRLQNLTELLRRSVEAELGAIDWGKEGLRRRYTLSAALVRLETSRERGEEGGLVVTCTVSAAVRDDRGSLLATLQGRAKVEGASSAALGAEQGALAGAVRGAISGVPEVIRRTQ